MNEPAQVSVRRLKFAELATKRVNRATQTIRTIGNLSNRSNYEYTEQDVHAILKELNAAIANVKGRFSAGGGGYAHSFQIEP